MNPTEQLMMKVIEELSLLKAPIVFKGAMILKFLLAENNPTLVNRDTRDIDGDWTSINTSMQELEHILSEAVRRADPTLSVRPFRNFAHNRAAGFDIVDGDSYRLFGVDLNISQNYNAQEYTICHEGKRIAFHGVSLSKMLADKICAMSSQKIFRRAKDLIDVYILSYAAQFNFLDIIQIQRQYHQELGDFKCFRERKSDLQHAYEKLRGVKNKPDFMVLYDRLQTFLAPFLEQKLTSLEWTGERWESPQNIQENTMQR